MFTLNLSLTTAALDMLKGELTRNLSAVKSSHRCEALGRSLGFITYAAARTAASSSRSPTVAVNGDTFVEYLADHGFDIPAEPLFHAIAKAGLQDVARRAPTLTIWGFGIGRPQRDAEGKRETGEAFNRRFVEARDELTSDYAVRPFLLSLALLERVVRTKTIRKGTGSYRSKHIAENYACTYPSGEPLGPHYVPNGAFIAAAIHAGFSYRSYVDELGYQSVNASFNMSKPVLDDLDNEIRPDGATAQDRLRLKQMRQHRELFRYNRLLRGAA